MMFKTSTSKECRTEKMTCIHPHRYFHGLLLLALAIHPNLVAVATAFRCLDNEASSLIRLKQSFQQPHLLSWHIGTNCCRWEGVTCDATSGRVTVLDLSGHGLQSHGGLDSALFQLGSLRRLNLAGNDFGGALLPACGFQPLIELTHLNLSDAGFAGQIPIGVGSLRNLVSLDLSFSVDLMEFKDPTFRAVMANLSNLRELHLDGVDMSTAAGDWCDVLAESTRRLQVLTMRSCKLSGRIPPSLSRLRSLVVVDLSYNQGDFFSLSGAVPEFLANFPFLTVLQLSNNEFNESFPQRIFQLEKLRVLDVSSNSNLTGNLPKFPARSSLEVLDLGGTNFYGEIPTSINNLRYLNTLDLSSSNDSFSGGIPASIGDLKFLEFLDLSNSGFSIGKFPSAISRLRSLSTLQLCQCGISGAVPSWIGNLTRLNSLDLSQNNLTGPLPFNNKGALMNLEELKLCCNSLSGAVPSFIFSLPRLEFISLMSNNLSGSLQEFSDPSPSLTTIYLKNNRLDGSIPKSFFKLMSLQTLDLSGNSFSGTVELSSFWRLRNLTNLDLSTNGLSVIDDEDSNPSSTSFPQINSLGLGCCNLTKIPTILRSVVVQDTDLSCNKIHGPIPNWIWENQEDVDVFKLNLSRNKFTSVELSLANVSIYYLDLSFNNLQGSIPIPTSPSFLDYSKNLFSYIPHDSMNRLASSFYLDLSNNLLRGRIPPTICNARSLQFLDLSYNYFSGPIPSCLIEDGHLSILKIRGNQFDGTLPSSIRGGCLFQTIDLNGNKLEGQLPRSLSNCKDLEVLDVGNNYFADSFPSWMGKLPKLRVLVLRSNRFHGHVKSEQNGTYFSTLQIIDLASNNFFGHLHPGLFKKLTAMTSTGKNDARQALENNFSGKFYRDTIIVTYKGTLTMVSRILIAFTVIDLSDNAFAGDIPRSIGRLASLHGLNMSHNALTGPIPSQLSSLVQVESLDLSWNQLTGEIPDVLASLPWLAWLNVSYNYLHGSIPQGRQFLTFTNSSFQGNDGLCGKPLSKQCSNLVPAAPNASNSLERKAWSKDSVDTIVLYIFVGSGFGFGFAMAILFQVICCGAKRWRWKKHFLAYC